MIAWPTLTFGLDVSHLLRHVAWLVLVLPAPWPTRLELHNKLTACFEIRVYNYSYGAYLYLYYSNANHYDLWPNIIIWKLVYGMKMNMSVCMHVHRYEI